MYTGMLTYVFTNMPPDVFWAVKSKVVKKSIEII